MTTVSEIGQVLGFAERIKGQARQYISNLFLDIPKLELWIKLRILEFIEIGKTVFLLKRNRGFSHLYFMAVDSEALNKDLHVIKMQNGRETIVLDLIGMEGTLGELISIFGRQGFYLYTTLVRMSKTSSDLTTYSHLQEVQFANKFDMTIVSEYFDKYFDPFCEQIPLVEELDKWVDKSEVIIYRRNNEAIGGFLISETIGQTAYLRYWFVHPEFRERKIGSVLIHEFFKNSESSKRKIFWVIKSNNNAIKRYEHYGFRPELLNDFVFINRDMHYEGKDN